MLISPSNLFLVTAIVAITTMAITLWMAFYLLARGFPNKISLRTVVVLLAVSAFFLGIYNNMFHQTVGSASWRAVLLIIAMAFLYNGTYHLMSEHSQRRFRSLAYGMYGFAVLTAVLILIPGSFIDEAGNAVYSSKMAGGAQNILYTIYQFAFLILTPFNLLVDQRIGLTAEGKYFLIASILPAGKIIYGVIGWITPAPLPRFVPDLFLFFGVFIFGLSVLRHQSFVERRTTFQDFPISALTILGLAALYALVALQWGIPVESLGMVVGFVILTLSFYDLVREFLERSRIRHESTFRRQLRQLENVDAGEGALQARLQKGLDLLCESLHAASGLVSIRRGDQFVVLATRLSVPIGSAFDEGSVACEDISRPATDRLSNIEWIAPSFEGQSQVAVVGIGKSTNKLEFSAGDLELLAEVADQVGTLVSLNNLRPQPGDQIRKLLVESQANTTELNSVTVEMTDAMEVSADPEFIKLVEDGLRHFPDVITLGQSALADRLSVIGESHIERGKYLQQILVDSINSLMPAEKRPPQPLPRIWYNHAVLHDAYVEGVSNREIMARLYISEGTFNRTRRNALRGLARMLKEKNITKF